MYLKFLHPREIFSLAGKDYVVIQHESNMTEVYDVKAKRYFAFWCWTMVTPNV